MAGEATTSKETPAADADPFAAAFAGLSSMKDGDSIPDKLDFSKPVETKPVAAATTEHAAETTGANADATGEEGEGITVDDDVEERPTAPTHKDDGTAYTAEEIAAEQARLDKEFDDAKAAKDAEEAEAARAAAAKQTDDDPIERLATTLERRLAPKEEPTTQTTQTETPKPFVFSAEEQAFITKYEEDFPDVVRAESLLRRREYHNMLTYIFNQFNQRLQPVEQLASALAQRTHHDDLSRGIDGYSDELLDKVDAWIEKQPDFLKSAYSAVMEGGTAVQVKQVVDLFRKETGTATPTGQAAAAAAATTAAKVVDPKAAAAAKAMAPVQTKRSQTTASGIPKEDFDAAFSEFAKEDA